MPPAERRRFRALFCAPGEDAVPELRSLLERRGANCLAASQAERFADEAISLVRGCGLPSESTEEFEEFARYVANRQR
jgi:geranylgeranyl pyrophosphate synthase